MKLNDTEREMVTSRIANTVRDFLYYGFDIESPKLEEWIWDTISNSEEHE